MPTLTPSLTLNPADRRRFPRFRVEPMYTAIAVRPIDSERFPWTGHAYDISQGGCRFELDVPIEPGTPVMMQIILPTMHAGVGSDAHKAVWVYANVIWIEDEDEPGPVKMACVFTKFPRVGDEERLLRELRTGCYRAAA